MTDDIYDLEREHYSARVRSERRAGLYENGGPPNWRERMRDRRRALWLRFLVATGRLS